MLDTPFTVAVCKEMSSELGYYALDWEHLDELLNRLLGAYKLGPIC
jgi:hypothetical protein